ncbi:Sperm flagellar protein 2 [Larimichthys crocea]|uniref:Uncharacterized protein n=1 Tax=Larimichthys crocea TaxID=215358 RepID=A0ACD3RDN5_LARCR|nr:Sperm flagellar protein 2 [Larimichthys crocea]
MVHTEIARFEENRKKLATCDFASSSSGHPSSGDQGPDMSGSRHEMILQSNTEYFQDIQQRLKEDAAAREKRVDRFLVEQFKAHRAQEALAQHARWERAESIRKEMELCNRFAAERRQIRYRKHFASCKDIVEQIVDLATKVGEYRLITRNLFPEKEMREWKELLFSGLPLYEFSTPLDPVELKKQEILNNQDYDEYTACVLGKFCSGKTTCLAKFAEAHGIYVLSIETLINEAEKAYQNEEKSKYCPVCTHRQFPLYIPRCPDSSDSVKTQGKDQTEPIEPSHEKLISDYEGAITVISNLVSTETHQKKTKEEPKSLPVNEESKATSSAKTKQKGKQSTKKQTGFISSPEFFDLFRDIISVNWARNTVPESWSKLNEIQLMEIVSLLTDEYELIDWRQFLLSAALPWPSPSLMQLLVSELWFSCESAQPVPEDPSEPLPYDRLVNLRRFFFQLFADHSFSPPRLDYVSMLQYFAADTNPKQGFIRALSVELGQHLNPLSPLGQLVKSIPGIEESAELSSSELASSRFFEDQKVSIPALLAVLCHKATRMKDDYLPPGCLSQEEHTENIHRVLLPRQDEGEDSDLGRRVRMKEKSQDKGEVSG